MRTETQRALSSGRNSFGQYQIDDLGFDKVTYYVTREEFEKKGVLPDNEFYGIKADDYTRKYLEFKPWEDPEDCKYIQFDIVNGEKRRFLDVAYAEYSTCLNYVVIVEK